MRVASEYSQYTDNQLWELIIKYLMDHECFYSVKNVKYTAVIQDNGILFHSNSKGTKRHEYGEKLSKQKILSAFRKIVNLNDVKTNTKEVIEIFPRQRSPFIGLLKSIGILI